jgi:hypothetical protein
MRNDDTEIVGKGTIHGEQSAGQATQAPAPQAAGTAPPPMVAEVLALIERRTMELERSAGGA